MMVRVEWLEPALGELTTTWLNADSDTRRAITEAAREIENALHSDPEEQGESRTGGRRILFAKPLAVIFRFDPEHELVTVLNVWRFDRRRN